MSALETPQAAVRCPGCGAEQPPADRCRTCQVWLPGNRGAVQHGLYSTRLPDDLKQDIETYRASVIAAQGGLDALEREPIRAGLVRSFVNSEIAERLTMAAIVRAGGVESRAGQRLYDRMLNAVDRKLRLAQALGLGRRAKAAGTSSPADDAMRALLTGAQT